MAIATAAFAADDLEYNAIDFGSGIIHHVALSPDKFEFKVVYTNPPASVQESHRRQPRAVLTVNGGYWTETYEPTDLLVSDGRVVKNVNRKSPFNGLFFVRGGKAAVRNLNEAPLSTAEQFQQAVKCGPLLVRKNHAVASKSTTRHRRTVVGRDKAGRIFFLVTDGVLARYADMTTVALEIPVRAEFAFNLDGGGSTGLAFDVGERKISVHSVPVGSVIQVLKD
ncbi:MAG: phosphodiester glycosidase family protein [Deltaproteobacteria bacterium]|nr:phosphodiester glycosidase family protein [Deltaproteobacteria bacterium]